MNRGSVAWAIVGAVLCAMVVVCLSLLQTPTYEVSTKMRVEWRQGERQAHPTKSGEEIQPHPPRFRRAEIILTMMKAIDTRPVAKEAIRRLEIPMPPAMVLANLTIERVEGTNSVVLTYKDADPKRAQEVVGAVSEVSSGQGVKLGSPGSTLTATVLERAALPETPVSPDPLRNGLLAFVIGLALSAALIAGRHWLRLGPH